MTELRRQRAGGDLALFVLDVMDVEWRSLAVRRQRPAKVQALFTVGDQPAELENLSRVPVLQPQRGRRIECRESLS